MGIIRNIAWDTSLSVVGNTAKFRTELETQQWMSQQEVVELQRTKLKELLLHSYNNVPYYRKILQENGVITANKDVRLDHYSNLPILSKETIKENFEQLKSADLASRKWYTNTSGGSTGKPVKLIQDSTYKDFNRAMKMLFDSWTGYRSGDRKVLLWGSDRDLFYGKEPTKIKVARYMRNEKWLNAFKMSEQQMKSYVNEINQYKPVQITAYVGSIFELARYIEEKGLNVHQPKAIITSAGNLYQYMRETVERVFNCKIFNRYGSREVADVAFECDHHTGLHTAGLTHFVEILNDDGTPAAPGEVGNLIVTPLTNYAMPLLRYKIGDMAVWSDQTCTCGRGLPLLKEITGRSTDVFTRKEGGIVDPSYFIHTMGVVLFDDWINLFQVVQEELDLVKILLVINVDQDNVWSTHGKALNEMKEKVQLVMGEDCRVEIEFVDDIPPTPTGKYRYTISNVKR